MNNLKISPWVALLHPLNKIFLKMYILYILLLHTTFCSFYILGLIGGLIFGFYNLGASVYLNIYTTKAAKDVQ